MNLIVFNNFVLEAVEKHIQVDVIYSDFAKAFDGVDHGCLIDAQYKSRFGEPRCHGSSLTYQTEFNVLKYSAVNLPFLKSLLEFLREDIYPRSCFLCMLMASKWLSKIVNFSCLLMT